VIAARVEEAGALALQGLGLRGLLRVALALLEFGEDLLEDFWIGEEVILDDSLDGPALIGIEGSGLGSRRCGGERQREGQAGEEVRTGMRCPWGAQRDEEGRKFTMSSALR
jgi:hypothetical protein